MALMRLSWFYNALICWFIYNIRDLEVTLSCHSSLFFEVACFIYFYLISILHFIFQLSVIVWNDLLDNIIHITLDVDYTDTTPQFINSSYSVEIPENIPVGSNVISILASVDYGDLSYSIQGKNFCPLIR